MWTIRPESSASSWHRRTLFPFLIAAMLLINGANGDGAQSSSFSPLWEPSEAIRVHGPTRFPKPSDLAGRNALVALEPYFGTHRNEVDAMFAYAEGYALPHYLYLIESLRETGFDGDVVLCIANLSILREGIEEYLRSQQNVVVYLAKITCHDNYGAPEPRRIMRSGDVDVFQMCQLDHAYGFMEEHDDNSNNKTSIRTVLDPRQGRVVATLRYELYWIWSLHYQPTSWILLLDARDSYFQLNPFDHVPRTNNDQHPKQHGRLHFFGENTNATRLGLSKKNRKWLTNAYGTHVFTALQDKPTICSGATMGEQIALETYLRAMVNEWDENDIQMTGADQGFHNYLYYSHKLGNADTIQSIHVFEQGRGTVNNLGALRDTPLKEWGILNNETYQVYNWDGSLSPVVHQWDRDHDLFHWTRANPFRRLERNWQQQKKRVQQ